MSGILRGRRPSHATIVSYLALFFAFSGTAYAAATINSADIVNESIQSQDIKNGQIKNADLGISAVDGSKVMNNSLTTADIAGADQNGGAISLGAGAVGNGACKQFNISVVGAKTGEAVVVSAQAAVQDGVILYGSRVSSDGIVTLNVCNFSGTTEAAITSLPLRVITFG